MWNVKTLNFFGDGMRKSDQNNKIISGKQPSLGTKLLQLQAHHTASGVGITIDGTTYGTDQTETLNKVLSELLPPGDEQAIFALQKLVRNRPRRQQECAGDEEQVGREQRESEAPSPAAEALSVSSINKAV